MELNRRPNAGGSCLYECRVMHHRLSPKKHKFVYDVFMLYLDLDELDSLSKRLGLFSRNAFNLFEFRDEDHFKGSPGQAKEKVLEYLRGRGVRLQDPRILLLTYPRVLGYVFNPVSFYFCFDGNEPACAVAEVSNTFGEMKPFFLGGEDRKGPLFEKRTPKLFYVSPFMDLDLLFDFSLRVPDGKLDLRVDDYKDGERILLSSLTGERAALTDAKLLWFALKYPLVTLKVIFFIHWNALLLYLKKIPHHAKDEHPELQKLSPQPLRRTS